MVGLLDLILKVCEILLIAHVILSLLVNYDVIGTGDPRVGVVRAFVSKLFAPMLRPLQAILPNYGAVDLSPPVLIITILAMRYALTLYPMYSPSAPPDQVRADTAKLLMAALEKYRSATGAYPLLVDKPIRALKSPLVDGRFLKEFPPVPGDAQMRYVSQDGKSYGILSMKNGKPCRIEVGVRNTGWWGLPSADLCSYD